MTWNVFYHNINSRNIEIFNIFDHSSFRNSVNKLKKANFSKSEFDEELKRTVMHYFWSKYEYEIVVTSLPPYINKQELERLNSEYEKHKMLWGNYPYRLSVRLDTRSKIDIYTQIRLNWSVFVEYVWRF